MSKKTTLGRKPALSINQQQRIAELSETKGFSFRQLAAMYGVSAMTICRIVKRSQDAMPEEKANHGIHPRVYSSYG